MKWPWKRKQSFGEQVMSRADQEIEKARQYLEQELLKLNQDFQRQYDEMVKAAEAPIRGFTWTPVITDYGQVVAIAWKNDPETARRLLEEPAEGRA